jgi:hypothetical protein
MSERGAMRALADGRPSGPSMVAASAWLVAAGLGVPLGLWRSEPTHGSHTGRDSAFGLDDRDGSWRQAAAEVTSVGPPVASFVCDSGGDWPRVEIGTQRHRAVTGAARCTSSDLEAAIDHTGGGRLYFGLIPTWSGPAEIEVEHRGGGDRDTTASIAFEVRRDGGPWEPHSSTYDTVGALRDGGVDGFPWNASLGIAAPRPGRYELRAVIHAVEETGSVVHLRNVRLVFTKADDELAGCALARTPKDCPLARRLMPTDRPHLHDGVEQGDEQHHAVDRRRLMGDAPE